MLTSCFAYNVELTNVGNDNRLGELSRSLHVALNSGKHNSSAEAEQNCAEGLKKRLELDRIVVGQCRIVGHEHTQLTHGLAEDEHACETGEEHGTDRDRPEVFGRTEHGNGRHHDGNHYSPVAEVQRARVEQASQIVCGDEKKNDRHAEQLHVGHDQHEITCPSAAGFVGYGRKRIAHAMTQRRVLALDQEPTRRQANAAVA